MTSVPKVNGPQWVEQRIQELLKLKPGSSDPKDLHEIHRQAYAEYAKTMLQIKAQKVLVQDLKKSGRLDALVEDKMRANKEEDLAEQEEQRIHDEHIENQLFIQYLKDEEIKQLKDIPSDAEDKEVPLVRRFSL